MVIRSKADEAAGKPMFPELNAEPKSLDISGIGVIEGGMASGKAAFGSTQIGVVATASPSRPVGVPERGKGCRQ